MIGYKAKPGETPITDFSYLKPKGLKYWKEVARLEAENIRKVLVKYLGATPTERLAPFDFSWVLRLHKEMFHEVWTWAGILRKENLNIGVHWRQVETRLFGLMEDLKEWGKHGMELHEQAVRLHHQAVWIHPFMNGNGRWARLLENLWLARDGEPVTEWPEVTIEGQSPIRSVYLSALRAADDGDYDALMALHNEYNPAKRVVRSQYGRP